MVGTREGRETFSGKLHKSHIRRVMIERGCVIMFIGGRRGQRKRTQDVTPPSQSAVRPPHPPTMRTSSSSMAWTGTEAGPPPAGARELHAPACSTLRYNDTIASAQGPRCEEQCSASVDRARAAWFRSRV